ncbi:hypothetical protein K488DRAFT_60856 [Vararia minispora EC-137]|uniref:Uncharacterized protein n=1 Tax=Vararia minispora EC-137 TaxID=1314806 RepID=A0ACB8Q7H1_9AGAM|nr:hypothetical protein K488DRAFT_60856 [Vararia minispora EC-137]
MLVVDLMHEFELGVWKQLLIHLIRVLHSLGEAKIAEFNQRFRLIPAFGPSTIRRFVSNVSELKKLAARDFEDILQCCIACIEGLLPEEHDESVSELLFLCAYWHALAKLRMHTDTTLRVLDNVTVLLGKELRHFADVTCAAFDTEETPGEYAARCRASSRRDAKKSGGSGPGPPTSSFNGKKKKTFNLNTYKAHSLPDYTPTIYRFGTTDSYSTQIGEAEHRVVKRRYTRTNRRDFTGQLVKLDILETIHERMYEELVETHADTEPTDGPASCSRSSKHTADNATKPYIMAADQANSIFLPGWLHQEPQKSDPAFQNFERLLKRHLLARNRGQVVISDEPEYCTEDLDQVILAGNTIYRHATLTINYTAYDVRRQHDLIHVTESRRERCDVMMRANDNGQHPFWYARVLGVYHANVFFPGSRKHTRVDFLFVRWFGIDPEWQGGAAAKRLDRIGYIPGDASEAFGFLDPSRVIRACHLIPVFTEGTTEKLFPPSKYRDFPGGDWVNYYVSRFVDRDMMMRYLGWGVGHLNSPDFPHEADALLASDDDRVLAPALDSRSLRVPRTSGNGDVEDDNERSSEEDEEDDGEDEEDEEDELAEPEILGDEAGEGADDTVFDF